MIRVVFVEGRAGQRARDELLNQMISPGTLCALAKQYDILLHEADGEITAWIDAKGCRFKQM